MLFTEPGRLPTRALAPVFQQFAIQSMSRVHGPLTFAMWIGVLFIFVPFFHSGAQLPHPNIQTLPKSRIYRTASRHPDRQLMLHGKEIKDDDCSVSAGFI